MTYASTNSFLRTTEYKACPNLFQSVFFSTIALQQLTASKLEQNILHTNFL